MKTAKSQCPFASFVEYGEDKLPNKQATLDKIAQAYDQWAAEEITFYQIKATVAEIFSRFPKEELRPMFSFTGLISTSINILSPPKGSETRLANRIKDFIHSESELFVKSRGDKGHYYVHRGNNGGVYLANTDFINDWRTKQNK
jgi:hypothetical protein